MAIVLIAENITKPSTRGRGAKGKIEIDRKIGNQCGGECSEIRICKTISFACILLKR
jgi:hypothetical protein